MSKPSGNVCKALAPVGGHQAEQRDNAILRVTGVLCVPLRAVRVSGGAKAMGGRR